MTKNHMSEDEVLQKHRPTSEMLALQEENAELRKTLKKYRREHGNLESLVHQVVDLVPTEPVIDRIYIPEEKSLGSKADVCFHLTDLHYGAVQPGDEVEGFGEYSPEIAEERLFEFGKNILDWVKVKRSGYDVRAAHVLLTGDYISGDIHEELRVTNAFPAPVQAVNVSVMLTRFIKMLLPFFESVNTHVITDDNHGRLSRKIQSKESGLNNWSYVVGCWLKKALEQNMSVNVIARPWESVNCNGRRYLLTHGHRVMGWAGFPYYGIERMVSREALKRMNAPEVRKFHKVVMGHWHAPLAHPWYWIGGSLSGTDAYDHAQGRHCEPKQVTWMIHSKHGEFDRTEWVLR